MTHSDPHSLPTLARPPLAPPTLAHSADPEEIARFERLSELWWQPNGPFWPLHTLNTLRVSYIESVLSQHLERVPQSGSLAESENAQPLAEVRILDIGCGGGLLSEAMAARGASVTGIDIVEQNVNIAKLHATTQALNCRYFHSSVEEIAERCIARDEQYDIVLNMEVVEHVRARPSFLAAASSCLRPGGLMFVATLNRTAVGFLFAIIGAEYILRWLPRGTHQWHKFVRPDELAAELETPGLQPIEMRGVRVNPFTRQFTLSRSLAVNYIACFIKRK